MQYQATMALNQAVENSKAFDNSLDAPLAIIADGGENDVSKRSKESAAMVPYWDMTDAIIDGVKGMRDAGKTFLPPFPTESKDDHEFRLSATKLTNIFLDVSEGLAAKPFEEPVSFSEEGEVLQEFKDFADNVDGDGNNISVFANDTFFKGIVHAVDWILIDYPTVDTTKIKTKKDQKKAGIRPFWSHVLGRNVLRADSKIIGGQHVLTLVRILEPSTPDKIREFTRDDQGNVAWKLYEKKKDTSTGKDQWVPIGSGPLTIDVIPIVPFATGRREGKGFRYLPAMQAAAELQIELYQQESALKFAKIMAAYPMLAGNGVKPERDNDGNAKSISIGPMKVLFAPPDGSGKSGNWAFIEPAATTLKFLAEDIKETKQDLRELGRQPLTAQGNVTVINSAMAAGKSKSAVGAWAFLLKDALENALRITAKWLKLDNQEPDVIVYTEFDNFLDGDDGLEHLREMRKDGDLSLETYHSETKRRGVLSSDFKHDDELDKISKEGPSEDFGDEELDEDGNPIEPKEKPLIDPNDKTKKPKPKPA